MLKKYYRLPLLVAMLVLDVNAILEPAVPSMAVLLNSQASVIEILHSIIKEVDQFSNYLKTTTHRYETEHYRAMADIHKYFINPIDVYTLLKRLSWDLNDMKTKIGIFSEQLNETSLIEDGLIYPSLDEACTAGEVLVRLQDYYQLDTTEVSNGILKDVPYSNPLTITDCYALGICLFDAKEFYVSNLWMHETLRRLEFDGSIEISRLELLEYISFNNYRLEDYERAIQWTEIILMEYPDHNEAAANKLMFKKMIQQRREPGVEGTFEIIEFGPEALHTPKRKWFSSLCRGEVNPAINVTRRNVPVVKCETTPWERHVIPFRNPELPRVTGSSILSERLGLKCRYESSSHPFLKIAPFKVEVLYSKPEITIFHDVLSDKEIQHVKRITRQQLRRTDDSTLVTAFLKNISDILVEKMKRRVIDMTQLSIHPADLMLVNKYDISSINNIDQDGRLLPMMTQEVRKHSGAVLLYLSDVEEGGHTVFVTLGLRIKPKKGSAVFVRQIPTVSTRDQRSELAACPVILGSKWVASTLLR